VAIKNKLQGKNIMACPVPFAGHNNYPDNVNREPEKRENRKDETTR